jgi:hypothetical protein
MAKVKTAPVINDDEDETPAVPVKTKVAKADMEELNLLAGTGKAIEDEVRSQTGGQNSFIKLIGDPQAKELQEGKSEYIKGAKYKSFVIGNKKINLGLKVEVTVLGTFKLYEETEIKKEGAKELPKIFGYWMPEDAMNIPADGPFDHPFRAKDGSMHTLRPVHWVAVYIHKLPDVEDAVFAFRSTGNSIYSQIAKMIKNQSEIAPQLRFTVTTQAIENKTWDKTNLYPLFEVTGKNFDMKEGKVSLIDADEGGMPLSVVKDLLGRYAHLQESYKENQMVARKTNIAGLIGAPPAPAKAALAGGKGKPAAYKEADPAGDEEDPTF